MDRRKYNKVAKIIGTVVGIVLVLGISYAVFRTSDIAKKINRIHTGDFNVIITDESEKAIMLENAAPMTVKQGKKLTPYMFSVENTGTIAANYKLYFVINNDITLPTENVKYNLVRTDTNEILSILKNSADDSENGEALDCRLISSDEKIEKEGQTLYEIDLGTIGPKQKQQYALRLWVSRLSGVEVMNKSFEAQIRVEAEQASTKNPYPVEEYFMPGEFGQQLSVARYSDNSIHYGGVGILKVDKLLAYSLMYDLENARNDINALCRENGVQETFSSMFSFTRYFLDNEENLSATFRNQIFTILENTYPEGFIDNPKFNGSVYFDEGIISIDHASVAKSNIKNLYINKTVRTIYASSFAKTETLESISFTDVTGSTIIIEGPLSIQDEAFKDCTNIKELILPSNLSTISSTAFSGCTEIKKLTMLGTKNYGDNLNLAFSNVEELVLTGTGNMVTYTPTQTSWYSKLSNIKKVVITNGITSIGNYAFYNCSSLTSISIPSSVTLIGNRVFYNCTSIKEIMIPNSVTKVASFVFGGWTAEQIINIDNTETYVAENWSSNWTRDTTAQIHYLKS